MTRALRHLYTLFASALVRAIVSWCTARKRWVDYEHVGLTYIRRYVIFGHRTGDPAQGWLRARLPNLYLHHMKYPDADPCLHDHPWPWAVSWILLGGYREERLLGGTTQMRLTSPPASHWLHAPALNFLRGTTFHRIAGIVLAELAPRQAGTFTLFFAGPRASGKQWGYLVPGRGFVHQSERHAEIDAREVRPQ